MLNIAKEAPSALLPHLEGLVGRIQQLWDAGQLREGEKVGGSLGWTGCMWQWAGLRPRFVQGELRAISTATIGTCLPVTHSLAYMCS